MAVSPLTPQEVVAATADLSLSSTSTSLSSSSHCTTSTHDPHNNNNNKNRDRHSPTTKTTSTTTTSSIPYKTETIAVECRNCESTGPEQGARALIMGPTPLSIIVCTNRLLHVGDNKYEREDDKNNEMTQILTHELVHAYDVQRLQLNFSDCETVAYSEVRAAREAECYPYNNKNNNSHKNTNININDWWWTTELCVRQRAIGATRNVFPGQGRGCVATVFRQAYNDPRPFSKTDIQRWWRKNSQSKSNQ